MAMEFTFDDGGRAAAGFTGRTGDCVTRAIAIASGKPYAEVYAALNELAQMERPARGKRSSSRTGVFRKTYHRYLLSLGFRWQACMGIGTGCKVHLRDGELPLGKVIARVSKHVCAVIDGVIHDTYDPQRPWGRCVYGYYILDAKI